MQDRGGRDRCAEERRRLGVLLSLYFQALVWVVDWCRNNDSNTPATEIPGFVIHGTELDDLKVDREELLARLIAGIADDPWVDGTEAFDYAASDGRIVTSTPGIAVDGTQVERLRIKPHPQHLPYVPFMRIFGEACACFNRHYHSLLFRYRGCLCEDPLRLVRIFQTFEFEQCVVLHEVREWYSRVCDQLECWTLPEKRSNLDVPERPPSELPPDACEQCLPPPSPPPESDPFDLGITDPRILSLKLTRPKMAEFLNCSVRTLRRWEQAGEAPGGFPWPRPEKVSGNLALYDVARYWKTIEELLPRYRSPERDAQLRDEILSDKYALRE